MHCFLQDKGLESSSMDLLRSDQDNVHVLCQGCLGQQHCARHAIHIPYHHCYSTDEHPQHLYFPDGDTCVFGSQQETFNQATRVEHGLDSDRLQS